MQTNNFKIKIKIRLVVVQTVVFFMNKIEYQNSTNNDVRYTFSILNDVWQKFIRRMINPQKPEISFTLKYHEAVELLAFLKLNDNYLNWEKHAFEKNAIGQTIRELERELAVRN
jgi:hypothetical protein